MDTIEQVRPPETAATSDDLDVLDQLLVTLVESRGSDLHLTVGSPPMMRVDGGLRPVPGYGKLNASDTELLARAAVTPAQWETFQRVQEMDFAHSIVGVSRFRGNLYRQRASCGAVFRAIPHKIKPLDELGMPESVARFAHLPRGLVLVTGPTGSGKTTTLASLLDLANRSRANHIITIEDPIEFLHPHKRSVVNQREVGSDTENFATALKHALRQDPDIILVGELRDLETTATALTAAETGHLVLATLHTQSATQTIDRVIDIFPPHQQLQIRAQLAASLQGVITQALAPKADGKGRVVVAEILTATPAIRSLIREGKSHQIPSFMQAGASEGMLAFDQHLAEKIREGAITMQTALEISHSPDELKRLVGRA
ncbi:putative type IV pilus retraction protein PilT [Actinoplanes missouriensis 431]|uniref:Putative type IV pilus retraction protein PilT n=1 Tax=Actinoplanes missouriensis (strain ATCC 14538 / DSM 43046 / CBS 188.64 / JCM 3121 / NBRC 102363 / NCIMB 12654 / NRRL B-3342 / UNCC 431) TaxID=512565 RepID=I0GZD8_ACTM4|nr:type IV pilus twitching motility protein PilT [Actinoplanes missouriensis]BAL86125.1 putative type IV pilus retraction protein PilT [Actinoplanes missouriensis 431]